MRARWWLILAAPLLLMGAYWTSIGFLNVNQAWTKGQGVTCVGLTDGPTIATDASASNCFTVTLGGNRTLANPTNTKSGQILNWTVSQDSTGGRTLAYGTDFNFPGGVPVLPPTASMVAGVISCLATDTTPTLQCGILGNFLQTSVASDSSGHPVLSGSVPSMGACGTSPSVAGHDGAFTVTTGSGTVTSCTVNFGATWSATPQCSASAGSTAVTLGVSAISTTAVTFATSASLPSGKIYALCAQ